MWTLRSGGSLLHDPRRDDLVVIGLEIETPLDEAGTMSFTVPPTNPAYDRVVVFSKVTEVVAYDDGEEWFRGRVTDVRRLWDNSLEVTCEGERAYLNDILVPPHSVEDGTCPDTAEGLFSFYVSAYNASVPAEQRILVGINDGEFISSATLDVSEQSRRGAWELIRDNLLALGGHTRVRHEGGLRYIDWLATGDHAAEQRIEFGRNLLDYSRSVSAKDWHTRLMPVGKTVEVSHEDPETGDTVVDVEAGQDVIIGSLPDMPLSVGFYKLGDWVVNVDAEREHGRVEATVSYDDVSDPNELLAMAADEMRSVEMPDTLELTALDLHLLDPTIGRIRTGDYVRCTSAPHGIDAYMMCSNVKVVADAPDTDLYTLGAVDDALTRSLNSGIGRDVTAVDPAAMDAALEAQRLAAAAQGTADGAATAASLASSAAAQASAEALAASNLASQAGTNAAQALLDAAQAQGTATNAGLAALAAQAAARSSAVYAESTSARTTINKIATIVPATSDFELRAGCVVSVRFERDTYVTSPRLNVNGTGNKVIRANGEELSPTSWANWSAGQVVDFSYDGTSWNMISGGALSVATSASSTASAAQTAASGAVTTANEAQTAASGAVTTAAAAQTTAAEAIDAALGSAFAFCTTAAATAAKVATITPATSDWTLAQGRRVTIRFRYGNTADSPTLSVNGSEAKQILGYYNATFDRSVFHWPAYATMTLAYTGTYWTIDGAAAYTNAFEATKTATNYLGWTDGEGLTVGDMTAGTLGSNALVAADGFHVRNGTTDVARFLGSSTQIGIGQGAAGIGLMGTAGSPEGTIKQFTAGSTHGMEISSDLVRISTKQSGSIFVNRTSGTTSFSTTVACVAEGDPCSVLISAAKTDSSTSSASASSINVRSDGMMITSPAPIVGLSHAISVKCNAKKILSSTTQNLTMARSDGVGDSGYFTIQSGGVKCAKAGTVMVSANCFFQGQGGMAGKVFAAYVLLGTTTKASAVSSSGGAWGMAAAIAPVLITVTANQIIYLAAQDQDGGGSYVPAGVDTNMTVMYVS